MPKTVLKTDVDVPVSTLEVIDNSDHKSYTCSFLKTEEVPFVSLTPYLIKEIESTPDFSDCMYRYFVGVRVNLDSDINEVSIPRSQPDMMLGLGDMIMAFHSHGSLHLHYIRKKVCPNEIFYISNEAKVH